MLTICQNVLRIVILCRRGFVIRAIITHRLQIIASEVRQKTVIRN